MTMYCSARENAILKPDIWASQLQLQIYPAGLLKSKTLSAYQIANAMKALESVIESIRVYLII